MVKYLRISSYIRKPFLIYVWLCNWSHLNFRGGGRSQIWRQQKTVVLSPLSIYSLVWVHNFNVVSTVYLPPVLRIYDILVWIRIRESGSCYFHHWPSRRQQKTILFQIFPAYYFLKVHLHHFSKIKSPKKSQNSRKQAFSYYFCLMIEESGAGSASRSILLTNGSGSRGPENMWIRWIPTRIRNTAYHTENTSKFRSVCVLCFILYFSFFIIWTSMAGRW